MNDKLLKEVIIENNILQKYKDDLEKQNKDLEKLIELKEKYLNYLKNVLKTSESK